MYRDKLDSVLHKILNSVGTIRDTGSGVKMDEWDTWRPSNALEKSHLLTCLGRFAGHAESFKLNENYVFTTFELIIYF